MQGAWHEVDNPKMGSWEAGWQPSTLLDEDSWSTKSFRVRDRMCVSLAFRVGALAPSWWYQGPKVGPVPKLEGRCQSTERRL